MAIITTIVDTFRYKEGQLVKCVNTSKENFEDLTVGDYYVIAGASKDKDEEIYAVRDSNGKLHFSVDRFVEVMSEYPAPFCEEDFKEEEGVWKSAEVEKIVHNDNVDHPAHYTSGKYEAIDVIEDAIDGLPAESAFLTGQVLKYMLRWFRKNGVEDLKKARWYLNRLIEKLEKKA